jgi:hypothetical protein
MKEWLMHVERAVLPVGELLSKINRSEIRLPELQRDFVWRPTQVAKLIDSLYRNYPFGSLLFWQADEVDHTRTLAVSGATGSPFHAPIYLLDGQQRLTALHRVFHDHAQAQIVFHIERERFQNQSATTKSDANWIKVVELIDTETAVGTITRRLRRAGCQLKEIEIERRLAQVKALRDKTFHVETLRGYTYDQIADIFVRVNSAGRHLDRADLAMSTLSARWPGVLDKFQREAAHWQRHGYGDLDVNFLSRAFAGVLFGGGLSSWSVSEVDKVSPQALAEAWDRVKRGLRMLIPLLIHNLGVTRSACLPSLAPLIPLTVLLGEHNGPVDAEMTNAILYWFLIATMRTRYSTSTDTNLSRDIQAARSVDPMRELLRNLGVLQGIPVVTPESLAGRTKESPYFFLSLLAAQHNGATDWWYGTRIAPGVGDDQELQYHHVHPVATLGAYDKGEINDLANLAFISRRANLKISDKSPAVYFRDLDPAVLSAHFIPLDESLRVSGAFPRFLAARRTLLAEAMTDLLERFCPQWLAQLPAEKATSTDGYKMTLVLYGSAWTSGRLVFRARGDGVSWLGSVDMEDLSQAVTAAAMAGIDSDVEIAGEMVPVQVVDDSVEVPVGPFTLSGSAEEWEEIFAREQASMQPLGRMPEVVDKAWTGERIPLSVMSTD